jgi:hypothetical protein
MTKPACIPAVPAATAVSLVVGGRWSEMIYPDLW